MTALDHPVWGIDPSTRRVALAILPPGGGYVARAVELGGEAVNGPKLAMARERMVDFFTAQAAEHDPGWLWVEQPFARVQSQVPVPSYLMLGVVMEAVFTATGVVANLIPPAQWKKEAGIGGFAKKGEILTWARARGFDGECGLCEPDGKCKGSVAHDLADALGIAAAGVEFLRSQETRHAA